MIDVSISDMTFWHLVAAIALGIVAARCISELASAFMYIGALVWAWVSGPRD